MEVVKGSNEINKEKKNKTINYISLVTVISTVAVVILHTNGYAYWKFNTDKYWTTANLIECLFYFAVPLFFMVTGVTLIDYRERYNTKEYFKKKN